MQRCLSSKLQLLVQIIYLIKSKWMRRSRFSSVGRASGSQIFWEHEFESRQPHLCTCMWGQDRLCTGCQVVGKCSTRSGLQGMYIMFASAMRIRQPTLTLKPRGDVTANPKQGHQWPHKGHVSAKNFLKRSPIEWFFKVGYTAAYTPVSSVPWAGVSLVGLQFVFRCLSVLLVSLMLRLYLQLRNLLCKCNTYCHSFNFFLEVYLMKRNIFVIFLNKLTEDLDSK